MSLERADSISSEAPNTASGVWTTMTSLTKQRVKLNMKLLGQFTGQQPNMKEDKPTYREQFVSPQMSMISYFLMKVKYIDLFFQLLIKISYSKITFIYSHFIASNRR